MKILQDWYKVSKNRMKVEKCYIINLLNIKMLIKGICIMEDLQTLGSFFIGLGTVFAGLGVLLAGVGVYTKFSRESK